MTHRDHHEPQTTGALGTGAVGISNQKLSDFLSQTEKEKPYDIPYMRNLEMIQMNFLTKQKETHRLSKWIYGCQGAGGKDERKG